MKKSSNGNKFFMCFRPLGMKNNRAMVKDVESDLDVKCCVANVKVKDLNHSKMGFEKKGFKSKGCSDREESIERSSEKKKSAKKILSKIVKAVVFESSLKKKSRNRKVGQDPLRSDSSLSSKFSKITTANTLKPSRRTSEDSKEVLKIDGLVSNSNSSSSLSSSALTSSSLSNSSSSSISSTWTTSDSNRSFGSVSERHQKSFRADSLELKKQNSQKSLVEHEPTSETKKQSVRTSKITGVCLLLMSLCVLIFLGKVVAILCTSTWFYFISLNRNNEEEDEPVPTVTYLSAPELIRSKEYKKKIVMDGFLERNHKGGGFNLHH